MVKESYYKLVISALFLLKIEKLTQGTFVPTNLKYSNRLSLHNYWKFGDPDLRPFLNTNIIDIIAAAGNNIAKTLLARMPILFLISLGEEGNGFKILGSGWFGTNTLNDAKMVEFFSFILTMTLWAPSSGNIYFTEKSPSGTVIFQI